MKKTILIVFLSMVLLLSGCTTSSPTTSAAPATTAPAASTGTDPAGEVSTEPTAPDLSKELTISVTRRGGVREVQDDRYSAYLKEKFNMIMEVTDINNSDYVTRMNLLFASGEATDVSIAHRPAFMLNDWIEAGYLRGFTAEEVEQKLPNFISHYAPDALPVVLANITHSDNKIYYLPGRRPAAMNMAWMYREDLFKQYNLEFPDSTDALFDVLMTLKTETGKIPIIAANAGDPMWAFTGFLQAFGMTELVAADISYVNPKSGEFVPYAFSTDNFRAHISYMNTLYANDLIWKEFSTGNTDQANKLQSEGNAMVIWGYPEKVATEYNKLSQTENPNASWTSADVMISATPGEAHYFKRDPYFAADGTGFNVDADEEKVDRFLYFMNWGYSDEGMVFHTYGFEGDTYVKEGDNYVFTDKMISPIKSEGLKLENYGVISMFPAHANQNEFYRPYLVDLANTFIGRDGYYFFTAPIMRFSEEESSELAELQTNLNQTRNEYYAKFIMGQIDVNNDTEWANYLNTMNKLGLERVEQIRLDAYERSN